MDSGRFLQENLLNIIDNARFAPSVHNSQPWRVTLSEDTITISIDERYALKDGDPTGRETVISLGIFTEAVLLSAEAEGLHDAVVSYENRRVNILFNKQTVSQSSKNRELIKALRKRATDRSIYKKVAVTPEAEKHVLDSWHSSEVRIWFIRQQEQIAEVARLTSSGIRLAVSNPSFRKELSQFIREPWSRKRRGISVNSLYLPTLLAVCEPLFIRWGIGLDTEARLERKRWESASSIVLITTQGDMPEYWFSAGRAYLHASLAIEQLGFSQATSAATVEASTYHEDVERILKTKQRLQCVLRIGQGSPHRAYSPRVDAKSLITS